MRTKAVVRFGDQDLAAVAHTPYVALSYVWGQASQRLVLRRENMLSLAEPGALDGTVSKTIADAMILTGMLGMQYLWVDALCILQDDTPDKSHHLSFMGQIYRHAQLTVIAASGANAEAGLPGIREPRSFHQHRVKVKDRTDDAPELHLISAPTIRRLWHSHYLFDSKWQTRGWTLQEKAISRRTLTFTETQVYWSCRATTWSEDMFCESNMTESTFYDFSTGGSEFLKVDLESTGSAGAEHEPKNIWDELRLQITGFAARELTQPSDGYDAISGVLQEFSRMTGENLLWAIPTSRFELGICWVRHVIIDRGGTENNTLHRRSGLTALPMTTLGRRVRFPSWSWLGWEGSVDMRFTDQYRETG